MSETNEGGAQDQAGPSGRGPRPNQSQQHYPRQQYYQQGSPMDMYANLSYDPRTSPSPPGSVYGFSSMNPEPTSKCSFCFALGCELYSAKKVIHDLTFKLMSKNIEREKRVEDVALSERRIEALQKEVDETKKELLGLKDRCFILEDKCYNLEGKCFLLMKEKEELLNAHHKIIANSSRNSSLVSKVNSKELTDTLDSSESEESTSKPQHAGRRNDRNPANDTRKNFGSTGASSGYQGGSWNNQQIRPNRNSGPRPNPQRSSAGYSRPQDGSEPAGQTTRTYQAAGDPGKDPGNSNPECTQEVIKETMGDIFTISDDYALAHCVGSDFIMSSGIAVTFRKKFRHVPELLEQNKRPGEVAYLDYGGRFIYYLVTKVESTAKPSWDDFECSVIEWSRLCVEHNVTKIAIPRMGCGRDQLDWNRVKNLINRIFSNRGIEILVCNIDQEPSQEKKWNLKLCHSKQPLSMLDPRDCALVFIASKDRNITPSIHRLASKYGFTSNYTSNQVSLGSLYQYSNPATKSNIFGLVVKEKHTDPISFTLVGRCFQDLRRVVKKMKLYYMGFEAFDDPEFSCVTRKLWTAVVDTFYVEDIEVYFCWPEEVKEKNWEERAH